MPMQPGEAPGARKRALYVAAAALTLALAGCSPGDVQFNGKIFDAVGLNNQSAPKVAQIKERQGLVVPPSLDRLPEPGTGQAPEVAIADVKDPDNQKKVSQAELERQQAEYCKQHYELAKMRGDMSADTAKGPLGLCRASVFSALQSWNKGSKQADEE